MFGNGIIKLIEIKFRKRRVFVFLRFVKLRVRLWLCVRVGGVRMGGVRVCSW